MGVSGSGLDLAGQLAATAQSAAGLNRDMAGLQAQMQNNLFSALGNLSQVYGQQANMRGALSEKAMEGVGVDLSWLPLLMANKNFQMPGWGGGAGSAPMIGPSGSSGDNGFSVANVPMSLFGSNPYGR
jgi:hypothetical protein